MPASIFNKSLNGGGRGFTLRLTVNPVSQDIDNNTSNLDFSLILYKGTNAYSSGTKTWSINIGGHTYSGSISGYNFAGYSSLTLKSSTSVTIDHDADGEKLLSVSGTFNDGAYPTFGSGTASGSMTLATIPRATQPTVTPTSGETNSLFVIGHDAASGSFYHDIAYSIDGGAYTNIATNLDASYVATGWTPAHSLFPASTGGTATIRVITRSSSGGPIIGTKTVALPLTVPASVKPTISSVAWADDQTAAPDMPTLMGAAGRYVQGWSKLKPTVSAAVGTGASGSPTSQVTLNGQVTPSGTAFALPVALSGAVPFTAVATDARSRTSDTFSSTVAVTAYNFPSLPTPLVVRTSDAGGTTPSTTGTYLAITPAASVSSLNFSGEKNLLEYQIRIKTGVGAYTTVQAWTATGVVGTTWTAKKVYSGYSAASEHTVEVSIRDLFGKNGYNTASTVKTLTVLVPSESVLFDFNRGDGVGVGKYHANGVLDVGGDIYQSGNVVIDTSDVASDTVKGIVELATDAEAQTGSDTIRAITPANLTARTATTTRTGIVELATDAEAQTATDTTRAITPANHKAYHDGLDSGWITVSTFSNSFTAASTVQYRKIGERVYIRGELYKAAAPTTATTVFTLPSGYRPTDKVFISTIVTWLTMVSIDSNGVVQIQSNTARTSGQGYSLGGIGFFIP